MISGKDRSICVFFVILPSFASSGSLLCVLAGEKGWRNFFCWHASYGGRELPSPYRRFQLETVYRLRMLSIGVCVCVWIFGCVSPESAGGGGLEKGEGRF